MSFPSYRNAVNVEMLSRVAVISGNLDHFIHLQHKVILIFHLATVKIVEHFSSLDAEYTIHFGAFVDRLGGSVYGQRCESKASDGNCSLLLVLYAREAMQRIICSARGRWKPECAQFREIERIGA